MNDPYYDRMALKWAELQSETDAEPIGDTELIARLTTQRPEELTYAPPAADVQDLIVDAKTGTVPVRVYRPQTNTTARALLVWIHGGAFLGGDLDMPEADSFAREVSARADAVVVSVDYRLCVEGTHYPTPNNDVIAAFEWSVRHATEYGADPERVSIGGASAGANLAAGAALHLRDAGKVQAASVVLAYPVVHPVLPEPTQELADKLAGLNPLMSFAPEILTPVVENYLGAPADQATSYAMAGIADDLTGLPPTRILNCEYDGLRASGERYAEQLKDAGIDVVTETVPDVAHGHLNRPALPQAQKSLSDISEWINKHALQKATS